MRATNTRREYQRSWLKRHPGYKAADSRLRALFRPASRAFYREILGVRVRVNLVPLAMAPGVRSATRFRRVEDQALKTHPQ